MHIFHIKINLSFLSLEVTHIILFSDSPSPLFSPSSIYIYMYKSYIYLTYVTHITDIFTAHPLFSTYPLYWPNPSVDLTMHIFQRYPVLLATYMSGWKRAGARLTISEDKSCNADMAASRTLRMREKKYSN